MKGICKGEIRAKESKLADFWERGCTKCGRLDFILVKKMEIKSGFTFWNLVFLLMVSCVKGRVAFEGSALLSALLKRSLASATAPLLRRGSCDKWNKGSSPNKGRRKG
uniref:Uncharacterized protein n=1 Tax=Apteryx owenii TaxID=8824 RepID=A0A8B9Q2G9_APTOW